MTIRRKRRALWFLQRTMICKQISSLSKPLGSCQLPLAVSTFTPFERLILNLPPRREPDERVEMEDGCANGIVFEEVGRKLAGQGFGA